MGSFHVKKGDEVVVIAGTEKGKRGKIIEVITGKERVIVEGVKLIKKHTRKSQQNPNGAIVERLNWQGDMSANGLKQSYGMMVNYRYKLSDVDANHETYAAGKAVASREVRAQAKG